MLRRDFLLTGVTAFGSLSGMAFLKLDCGMLDSTLWPDHDATRIFFAALMMARPRELKEPLPQIEVRSLEKTGFEVPPGMYGFVPAAGPGIVRRAEMDSEPGLSALERLGAPEMESRTPDHGGRRMIRVDGGYIILNYWKYREKDHTAAIRAKRHRAKKAKKTASQVKSESLSRERRAVQCLENGDQAGYDRTTGEDLPGGLQ